MNIFAQQGHATADKIENALDKGFIKGAILSPRYIRPERMKDMLSRVQTRRGLALIDPEFYATGYISNPAPNLGALEEWDYFQPARRKDLISGTAIPGIIKKAVESQAGMGVDACIAPNLYIKHADSIDTAIALNILNQTKARSSEITDKPVYGTIALHRDALLANNNFRDILDGLTGLDNPPDGYYITVGSNEMQSTGNFIRSDLDHPEVLAAWMYMNYALSLNGAKVINGYCFQQSPLLAICGAEACASGWFSGLRKFCINKYIRQGTGGGNLPNARYLSNPLLSFIRQTEYAAYRQIVPEIANGLSMDTIYETEDVSQTNQSLQSWEALHTLAGGIPNDLSNISKALEQFIKQINHAQALWSFIQSEGFTLEIEPNLERLGAMIEAIQLFKEWAEIAP